MGAIHNPRVCQGPTTATGPADQSRNHLEAETCGRGGNSRTSILDYSSGPTASAVDRGLALDQMAVGVLKKRWAFMIEVSERARCKSFRILTS